MATPATPAKPAATAVGLSVAIITKNEAHRIAACLASVAFADQVVVVDSGSTDDTVAIARGLGAEVIVTDDWPGFGPQKNRALAACRGQWVLALDADERLTGELATEILSVVGGDGGRGAESVRVMEGSREPESGREAECDREAESGRVVDSGRRWPAAGYWLRRHSSFCGQLMRHGLWGHDRVLRLFRREAGRFSDDRVHERVLVDGPTATLTGILLHDSVDSIVDAEAKARHYAALGAEALRERGHGSGGLALAVGHGAWTFVRGYLLRAGFLDGRNGLLLAWISARGTYWKYRWAGDRGSGAARS